MSRQHFLQRLRAVENESRLAAVAVASLREAVSREPGLLKKEELTLADLTACQEHLEPTYIIRLFAEFETSLRLYWRHVRKRRTWNTIRAEALIGRVAAYQHVPENVLGGVQEVRELRNALVHRAEPPAEVALPMGQCSSRLRHFLSYLPLSWPPLRKIPPLV